MINTPLGTFAFGIVPTRGFLGWRVRGEVARLGSVTAADRARARMVDALVASGRVRSTGVEEALRAVPRHLFLPDRTPAAAYADEAVAVQFVDGVATSSASQPSMMAIMLEQLGLAPGQRVLEIGAGTGYNAALMARIVGPAGSVTSLDIDLDLVASAAGHLAAAGIGGIALVCADGALGYPPAAPYDRIALTVGAADVRPEWVAQLAPGGRLLVPLAVRGSQLSTALDLGPDGVLRSDSVRSCAFIRLRGLGAAADAVAELPGGFALHLPSDGPSADPDALAVALREVGEPVLVPAALSASDVFDGFGLWLALTEPGACRVWRHQTVSLGLVTPPGAVAAGLAVVDPATSDAVTVHPFGPAGAALAERMLAAVEGWRAAGAPQAADRRITVLPADRPPPGGPAVRTEYCWVTVS
jgi:protein-L-isoaspartate(D-aspartate) O-methyltransferase